MDKICFERPTFNMYLFILVCLIIYLLYFKFSESFSQATFDPYSSLSKEQLYNKLIQVKDLLHNTQLKEQKCQIDLNALLNSKSEVQNIPNVQNTFIQNKFLDKIYNPLAPPENIYPGGNFLSKGPAYDGYQKYQMLGYLTGEKGQFPVFGRYKYPGKTDKLEYYTIDDSRGRIKIPFKTTNYNELYDGDSVNINELGSSYIFKKYQDEGLRYNPNIL